MFRTAAVSLLLPCLLGACSERVLIYRDVLHYSLPESEGARTVTWNLQSNGGHLLRFEADPALGEFNLDYVEHEIFSGEPEFAFTYAPSRRLDLAVNIGPETGIGGKLKFQLLGKDQAHAAAGDASLALSAGVSYQKDSAGGYGSSLSMTVYYLDAGLSAGVRLADRVLLYGGAYYCNANYSGDINNVNYEFNKPIADLNLGLALFMGGSSSLVLEAGHSALQWRNASWNANALGLRFEKDIRF